MTTAQHDFHVPPSCAHPFIVGLGLRGAVAMRQECGSGWHVSHFCGNVVSDAVLRVMSEPWWWL
eukprot:341627-Prymnesium_polylepis.1